ncbi:restriction endonuclease [Micromonospora matsumotoense]|uniref:restriction endonuclease n=1 Tax=Micromonospora matsumotoense TaxID=121616 RepID=UPI0033E44E3D
MEDLHGYGGGVSVSLPRVRTKSDGIRQPDPNTQEPSADFHERAVPPARARLWTMRAGTLAVTVAVDFWPGSNEDERDDGRDEPPTATPRHPEDVAHMTSLRFGDDKPWIPTQEWARAWEENAPGYWLQVLTDYRDRVKDYYAEQFHNDPTSFPLMGPTRILIVFSLARAWTFAMPGAKDEVLINARWEDESLANSEILRAPNHEQTVRTAATVAESYRLVNDIDMTQGPHCLGGPPHNPYADMRIPGIGEVSGWHLADSDESARQFENALAEMTGRKIDRSALRELRAELARLDQVSPPQSRGILFEDLVVKILAAHGCAVERGKHRPGEQVDVFVHRPFRALLECRWQQDPVGVPPVTLLIGKLTRDRPALVAGIYVSMSGFTSEAPIEAERHARERVVILLDRRDVEMLLEGEIHVADLVEKRVDALVRRF